MQDETPANLRLHGAAVLGSDGLEPRDLGLAGGRIHAAADGRMIDLRGFWVLPGLVDLHGDGFERHLAPRRGMVRDLTASLPQVEMELASCGITTAWLAQFWSWEGGMRAPEFATRLAHALQDTSAERRIDLRMQLRLETHMTGDARAIEALIRETGIDYLVFNDHLPHDRLETGRTPPRLAGSALKAGRAPEAHHALMQALHEQAPEVPAFLARLATTLSRLGLHLGSHDDPDAQTRATFAQLGATISEFPTAKEAARAAREAGQTIIMGAPNVLRGGSHNRGGLAAEDLIAEGLVDALASDYHYPAMIGAALALVERGTLPLSAAWALISAGPATIMGLKDRGSLTEGKRADLVIFDPETKQVIGCFAQGRPVWIAGPLADRLM